jgi:hypothetical protein
VHERAVSLRQTLEAEALLGRGLVDRTLLERARQLDPQNQRAKALLEQVGSETRWNIGPGLATWARWPSWRSRARARCPALATTWPQN